MKINQTIKTILFMAVLLFTGCNNNSSIEPNIEDDNSSSTNVWQIDGNAIYTYTNNNRVYVNKHVVAVDFNCPLDTVNSITINDNVFYINKVFTNHFNFSSVNRPDIRDYIIRELKTSEVVSFKLSHGYEFSVTTDGFKFVARSSAAVIAFAAGQILKPKRELFSEDIH